MATRFQCFDDPGTILKQPMCLSNLSKDLAGALKRPRPERQLCKTPPCQTLKTLQALELKVEVHRPCDAEPNFQLRGKLIAPRLVSALDHDGGRRGFHSGDFTWTGALGLKITGRLSGVTNVGTHRKPAFPDCQTCDARGIMEGKLCGRVVSSKDPSLKGAQVIAAYRIRFEPTEDGAQGDVRGTLEGVVIRFCRA